MSKTAIPFKSKERREITADASYRQGDTLRSLIVDNNLLLMVMSRFGISLGFGDKRVEEVCREDGVDVCTFLAVCNFISGRPYRSFRVSLPSLTGYLRRAHSYFLDFELPAIRRKIIESINCSDDNDVAFLLLRFYDDYVSEVERHMGHENTTVFKYVEELSEGVPHEDFNIGEYEESHNSVVEKLNELKDIFIYHYHQKDNDLLNSALFDIINCEKDLVSHCEVEDKLFVPAVKRMELEMREKRETQREFRSGLGREDAAGPDALSARERDIVRCVAKGMANKEIAEELKLSFHTITTYRRNISSKLGIHSPAGLTIFAIIHKLIDLKEVRAQ